MYNVVLHLSHSFCQKCSKLDTVTVEGLKYQQHEWKQRNSWDQGWDLYLGVIKKTFLKTFSDCTVLTIWGEILRPPENSVPQTIVLRYKEIGGILCTKQRMVLFLSKEYLDRNITFFSMLPTQFIPNFFVVDYYGLRNTIFWGSRLWNNSVATTVN
jgi:hypothetical protein